MCMKYEDDYGVCFDWPFIYDHLSNSGEDTPINEFFQEQFNIKVNDTRKLKSSFLALFAKLHEDSVIEPKEELDANPSP